MCTSVLIPASGMDSNAAAHVEHAALTASGIEMENMLAEVCSFL